jgi:hypothetical protein
MRQLADSQVTEVIVKPSGASLLWCVGVLPSGRLVDLGSVLVGFDGRLTERLGQARDLLGSHVGDFLDALGEFLNRRGSRR